MNSRVVLVTGASRGIGKAAALMLAEDGFDVIVHYHTQRALAEEVCREICARGRNAELCSFDLADRETCSLALANLLEGKPPLYGVVCNAGIIADGSFVDLKGGEWDRVLRTNLDGFYNVLQPLLPGMIAARLKGRIVTLSSVSGLTGKQGQVNYSAAKAGIIGATKALARETARYGITVNCVAPGLIKTDMTSDISAAEAVRTIPLRRFGTPEEVAGVIAFLCSDRASYVTGQMISVNGGLV